MLNRTVIVVILSASLLLALPRQQAVAEAIPGEFVLVVEL